VDVFLDLRNLAAGELGLDPEEKPSVANDDIRDPGHHGWPSLDLESEPSPVSNLCNDLSTKLGFWLTHNHSFHEPAPVGVT
jgi:hypothetical protein